MITIAPFLIICKLLVRASAQAEGSPTDSALGNFTALFLEHEVRNFVDDMIQKARSIPIGRVVVNEFCKYVEMDITPALEFLFGYLLDRSRSYELATAMCVDNGSCPAKALLNKFDKQTSPDRLVDLSNFVYCQHRPDATFSECSKAVLTTMTDVAVRKVDAVCSAKNPDSAFEEFCSYYKMKENFGGGMLVSFLSIFSHAAAHCTDRKCS
ncbi:hypothetical protein FOL47_004834 [Perkinsus chesapeaki]|uniref:Secreted protein n=1 Tax=Perkinsus chesapeaki TaxID=330153 RepID=A0A7J6M0J6_PERCH|nr:hypothetical protein FOL47_004834 [Perkinsus chesapeaki]